MRKSIELREKRAKAVADARVIFDKADEETRDLSSEEETQYDKIDAEIRKLDKEIEKIETLEAREKSLIDSLPGQKIPRNDPDDPDGKEKRTRPTGTPEYRSAYESYLRGGESALGRDERRTLREVRAMQVGTDSEGGFLVPDEMNKTLIAKLEEENAMRRLSTVIQTSSGNMEIAAESSRGSASWTAEEAAFNESDDAFAQVLLGAHKATRIIKVSEELVTDSVFPIEPYLVNSFARSFGDLEETAFFVGDGSGKPTGIVVGSGLGVTAAGVSTVTADELIDFEHSLLSPYRRRATFAVADATVAILRKLKDGNGVYMWQPGLQADTPNTLLAHPIVSSSDMAAMTTGLKSMLFADFSFYWIADRAGRTFKRLNELYAANGQIGFAAMQRVDGKLTIAESAKHLIQA